MNDFAVLTPPLHHGDRLTRPEFERRYHAMPQLKKAELIDGTVYMASPLHFDSHARPHALIMTWLGTYYAATPGILLGDNATVQLDGENEPQPDALLSLPESASGKCRVTQNDYLEGPPNLIVEVAASSASYDLHQKRQTYRRHGVQEYLVWRVYDQQIDWFILQNGDYVTLTPDNQGLLHSQIFPGLVLDVAALRKGDLATVLARVQQATKTREHREFVKRLGVVPTCQWKH